MNFINNKQTYYNREISACSSVAGKALVFLVILLCLFGHSEISLAQCGKTVPSSTVNLSARDDSTWTSSSLSRNGNCCATTSPIKCVNFTVTLAPTAAGIIFNLAGGAGGTTYYINCVNGGRAGTPQCLTGSGPWSISFCKSGSNASVYTVTSVPKPYVPSKTVYVTSKCQARLSVKGLVDSSITWTSLGGSYNSYLSCTSGCDTTYVSAGSGFPSYVDYEVCGTPLLSCYPHFCDTIRVYYTSALTVTINPSPASYCYDSTSATVTATASGSRAPYTYLWNTGETTSSITKGAGTYIVKVLDSFGCSPVYDTVVISKIGQIKANAGGNASICASAGTYTLNGSVQTASGGIWSGGAGTYSSANTVLNATYTPTAGEISSGSVKLFLTTTGNQGCTQAIDSMILIINPTPDPNITGDSAICEDSVAEIYTTNSVSGDTYSWAITSGTFQSGQGTNSATVYWGNAGTGHVSVTETTSSTGCSKTSGFDVTVHARPGLKLITH